MYSTTIGLLVLIAAAASSARYQNGHYYQPYRTYEAGARILRYNNQQNGDGTYQFDYQTENNINQRENGYQTWDMYGRPQHTKEGSYSYVAPTGELIQVNYVADEHGFRTGTHQQLPDAYNSPYYRSDYNKYQWQTGYQQYPHNNGAIIPQNNYRYYPKYY